MLKRKSSFLLLFLLIGITFSYAQIGNWKNYSKENTEGIEGTYFTSIDCDIYGNIWAGYDDGVYKYNGESWTRYFWNNARVPIFAPEITIAHPNGDVWFGSRRGIIQYDGRSWTQHKTFHVNDIAYDSKGKLYVGLYQGGIYTYDGKKWELFEESPFGEGVNTVSVLSLAFDSKDNLWVGYDERGLHRFDGTSWETFNRYNNGTIQYKDVHRITVDKFDSTWVMYSGIGISKVAPQFWTQYDYENTQGVHGYRLNESISNIMVDDNNNIWVSTYGGLFMYNQTDWYDFNILNSDLMENDINDVCVDKDGNAWCATTVGISVLLNDSSYKSKARNIISGKVFLDENSNGIKDLDETYLKNQFVEILPLSKQASTSHNFTYNFRVDSGTTYYLSPVQSPTYKSPKDTLYKVTSFNDTTFVDDIPMIAIDTLILSSNIVTGRGRCDQENIIKTTVSNKGTLESPVRIELHVDNKIQIINSITPYDSISDNILYFSLDNIAPQEDFTIEVETINPDFSSIGEFLINKCNLITADHTFHNYIKNRVTCSYDPNIKTVSPLPIGNAYDTKIDTTFQYTIHFQNTGNDTAYFVSLIDSLDVNLDFNSFEFVESSHSCNITLSKSGIIKFDFPEINLVDSTTNPIESIGYASFKISPKKDVNLYTRIYNKAHIFFDHNPAIITNTTTNRLVNELPEEVPVGFNTIDDKIISFHPLPLTSHSTLKIDDHASIENFILFNIQGKEVIDISSSQKELTLTRDQFHTSGIYIYQYTSEGEIFSGKLIVQ